MKSAKRLAELIETARAMNIPKIEIDGVTYHLLAPVQPALEPVKSVPELKAEDLVVPESVFDNLSDEEILYYASAYYDELQAAKEAKSKPKLED